MVMMMRLGGVLCMACLTLAGCDTSTRYLASPYPAYHFSSIRPPEGAVSSLPYCQAVPRPEDC